MPDTPEENARPEATPEAAEAGQLADAVSTSHDAEDGVVEELGT